MSTETTENTNLQDQAYDLLLEKILFNEYEPGQKLSMRSLERELGIGRTPISGALGKLEQQGLIEKRPGSGTYVSKIHFASVVSAQLVRSEVEKKIMRLSFGLMCPDFIEDIREIINHQEAAIENNDIKELMKYDDAFHEKFYRIANHMQIWKWVQDINMHLDRYRWLRLNAENLDLKEISAKHREILEALENGDYDQVLALTDGHNKMFTSEKDNVLREYIEFFN
ncbi:MAG: GntR family transcriptional regulator [Lactobacillales bacterium]|jgi:DNA-binding GntR family transcriptional regulator|nr:GntR family transcriptional regulator [Lactobacillales bacterium]